MYISRLFGSFSKMFWTLSRYQEDTCKHTLHCQSFTALLQYICRYCYMYLFCCCLDRCSDRGAYTSACVLCGQNSSNKATSNFKRTEVGSRDYKSSFQSYLPQEVQTCQFGMFSYWTHWTNYDCPSGRCST